MATYLKLLGVPALFYQKAWHPLPTTRSSTLLFYLAYRGDWVDRGQLVYLFWPDTVEQTARRRLSRLLIELKKLPYANSVEIEPDRLRWRLKTDCQDFAAAVREGRLTQAVKFYVGALLETFSPHDLPEFEAWLELERSELQAAWRKVMLTLATSFEDKDQYVQAAAVLEQLHKAEAFDETVLRRYLENLQRSRQEVKATEVFSRFKKQLEDEFGSQPEPGTLAVLQTLRQGAVTTLTAPNITPQAATGDGTRYNLPVAPTHFIGREAEMLKLARLLADPVCRLVTIFAPGGMGKTRLAVETARAHRERFEHGVWFVSFVPVNVPEAMVYAVADALDLNFFGQREPKIQLFEYLAQKNLLLVLDNLEHLLSGVQLISELLGAAPGVKVLATSRARLNLQAEYLFDLQGLAVPEKHQADAERFDALQLFCQRAEYHLAEFALDENTVPHVTHICTLVEGMPLAIELAAGWLRVLSVSDISAEIETGIGLLETSTHDVPSRQQSIRVVFDHSWSLLTGAEQTALKRLSVFQGGFRRDAALEVANVTLPVLASLVNQAFLSLTPHGRYHRHPLVIQYAKEKLAENLAEKAQTEEKHGLYYLNFVQNQDMSLMTPERKRVLKRIEDDFANLKAAWYWATREANTEALRKTAFLFSYHGLGQLHERLELFSSAAERFDSSNPAHHAVLGALLSEQGFYQSGLGHRKTGQQTVQTGLALCYLVNDTEGILNGLCIQSQLAWEAGDFPESKRLADEGLTLARQADDGRFIGYFLAQLATVIKDLQIPEREQLTFYQQGLIEVKGLGMLGIGVLFTHFYALFLLQHGYLEEAKRLAQDNLQVTREFGYGGLESRVIDCLAMVAYQQGDYPRAYELLQAALTTFTSKLTETHLEAHIWGDLGKVTSALGDFTEARDYLKRSFQIGFDTDSPFSMTNTLVSFAELYIAQGQAEQAAEWLSLSLHHPGAEQHSRKEAERLLGVLGEKLSPETLTAATERGRRLALTQVVQAILTAL